MRYDDLIKPISADAPCGPDLLETDNDNFLDYYFSVEDRMPTSYYNLATETLFDSKTIDHKAETAQIDPLLKQSRDLRLLGIEAKFQILSGRFKGFVQAVHAMAGLLEAYPEDVHPQITADNIDRRNAIEELDTIATVVTPLDYAILMSDRRFGDISYRAYATGMGLSNPRAGEEAGDAGGITGVLGNSENATAVDALHEQLVTLKTSLETITQSCQTASQSFNPGLERLTTRADDILQMVLAARNDLGTDGAAATETGDGDAADAQAAPTGNAAGGTAGVVVSLPVTAVPTHHAARQVLESVERYFARYEPSSLALVLVTQSRLLVGRPLIEAMDALLERTAEDAVVEFGTDNGFKISMSRMRELSGQSGIADGYDMEAEETAQTDVQDGDTSDPSDVPNGGDSDQSPTATASQVPKPVAKFEPPDIIVREQATQALKMVEEFFQVREPASPIPILLFKARNLLNKDFHGIVRELFPPAPSY